MRTLPCALALLIAVSMPALAQEDAVAGASAPKPVKLMEVAAGTSLPTRHFFGRVVARQSVDLAFQVGGEITDFSVIEGQTVKEDELIASLDLELFQLQFEQARLQLEQADRTLERLSKLAGSSVSQVTIDDAETTKLIADVALRQAEYNIEHSVLLAPFDGLVALRHTEEYNTVAAGTPVVRLHDMSEIRVEIDVPEVLFQQSGEEDAFAILARFPAQPDKQYPMTVREYDAQASDAGQSFRVTLGMQPADDLEVLPGSSVEISVSLFSHDRAITLPTTALLPVGSNGDLAVMLFEPGPSPDEGTVVQHPVKVEVNNLGGFTVVEGLSGGEQIVATGVAALADGQPVRRFNGFAK
jgi:RND family efflux transporter MFP subunit